MIKDIITIGISILALLVSLISLYRSYVNNKSLKTESKIRQIIRDFSELSYTLRDNGQSITTNGFWAYRNYLDDCLFSGELTNLPVKREVDSCIERIDIIIKEQKLSLIRNTYIKLEFVALNKQVIIPIIEVINSPKVVNEEMSQYINGLNLKLSSAKKFIEDY